MNLRRQTILANRPPLDDDAARTPHPGLSDWLHAQAQRGADVNQQSDPDLPDWLQATVEWEREDGLRVKLRVAQDAERVAVVETLHGYPAHRSILPNLLDGLPPLAWENVDQIPVGISRSLRFDRMDAFEQFIRQPKSERRLPVILVSLTQANTLPLDSQLLVERVGALAHVVVRRDRGYWGNDAGRLRRRCFNGTVGLYWPDYDDEASDRFRFWPAERFAPALLDETLSEITAQVCAIGLDDDSDISLFAEVQAGLARVDGAREERAAAAKRIRAIQDSSQAEAQDFAELLHYADEEIRSLKQDRDARLREVRELTEQNRQLAYRLNTFWEVKSSGEEDEPFAGPSLWLSEEATEVMDGLDAGQYRELCTQILDKLLEPKLREAQEEVVGSGTLRVFPRGRTAGGKRVILRGEDADLLVCEIFADHNTYDNARNRGFDADRYQPYEEWRPGGD
jgi:hypothetical protein